MWAAGPQVGTAQAGSTEQLMNPQVLQTPQAEQTSKEGEQGCVPRNIQAGLVTTPHTIKVGQVTNVPTNTSGGLGPAFPRAVPLAGENCTPLATMQ